MTVAFNVFLSSWDHEAFIQRLKKNPEHWMPQFQKVITKEDEDTRILKKILL